MIDNDIIKRIDEMRYGEPIENPCVAMDSLGFKYEYHKGIVDKTENYTRVEEDRISYKNDKIKIIFNLASRRVVFVDLANTSEFYGAPVMFLSPEVLWCITSIMDKLGWM